MREINQTDFEKLNESYLAGDFNSLKVVHSKLLEAQRKLTKFGEIQVFYKGTTILVDSKKNFLTWVGSCFPDVLKELNKGTNSILNDDKDFPKFKETQLLPKQIKCGDGFWRIKKLEVFGQKQQLKQNYQRIIEIDYNESELLLEFRLDNNASLQIYKPEDVFESNYLLRIEEAEGVEFKVNTNHLKFTRTTDELIEVNKDDVFEYIIGTSIFLNSVEIIK